MKKEVLASAIGIGLLPPIWAVLSGYVGITCGAVALICAGIYAANGNKVEDGLKISMGFLMSVLWAVIALWSMENLPFSPGINTFATLAIMGFAAVLIASALDKWIYLPAVLCGWAIGLTIMGPLGIDGMGTLPLQIATAMLVGVWYVGWGVDAFCKFLLKNRK